MSRLLKKAFGHHSKEESAVDSFQRFQSTSYEGKCVQYFRSICIYMLLIC